MTTDVKVSDSRGMQTFRLLVEASSKIAIISHLGPDADAIGSALSCYTILKEYYPSKEFIVATDGAPGDFVNTFANKEVLLDAKPSKVIQEFVPDLVIFTDATEYLRFEYEGGRALESIISDLQPKLIAIDHHQYSRDVIQQFDLYRNNLSSSASEEVIALLVEEGYTITKSAALPALVGMIADTGRFLYPNSNFAQTCGVLQILFNTGLNMQDGQECLDNLKEIHTKILGTHLEQVVVTEKYTYSFLTDQQVDNYFLEGNVDFGRGTHMFTNQYAKSINGRGLGFMVHKDPMRPGFYKGSFRSLPEVADCVYITSFLSGGGHKTASGFGFEAASLQEAIHKVLTVIDEKGLLG